MKKHIIVTCILILVLTGVLAGFFIIRSRMDETGTPGKTDTSQAGITQEQSEQTYRSKTAEGQSGKNQTGENQIEENRTESSQTEENLNGAAETDSQADAPDQEQITMMFTGDVLFANSFSACYESGGIDAVVAPELRQQMKDADILMVNEEFPFSTRGTQMEDKQYTFRADLSYVSALNELGVDIVSLANNHILDYGKEALSDTFTTLDQAGIRYAGAGESASRAKELQVFEVGGHKIGILAASRVIPVEGWNVDNQTPGVFTTYDPAALCAEIEKAKETCDYVVVFVHWGVEYEEYPQDYQRSLAKNYIDSGADLVIGGHTHCLEGIEYYKGSMICYSLGNFIFGSQIDRSAAVEVTLTASGEETDRLIPVYATGGCTKLMDDADAKNLYQYMQNISEGVTISAEGNIIDAETAME
ncbi:MAG: CapA family protein [Lachnospiraceae bacterium]|nr:CapA family protein [Lachnospiraceae bacterium]